MLYYNPPLSDKEMVEKSARRVGLQLPDLSGIPAANDEDDAAASAELSNANTTPESDPAEPKR